MRVELRQGGHIQLVDLDVEQEVRRGRLGAAEELRHPPWTGDTFRRLGDIPALEEAFESREARFAAWVRSPRAPWASAAVVAVVACAGGLQIGANLVGLLAPDVAARVQAAVLRGAIGYEPLLLDGAWWSPWTSQLIHAGAVHLVMNLPVLAYCGFRVERALGAGGLLVVAAASVLSGSALVTGMGSLPVVGASILAYGFWGAQIAIGFRAGEAMPRGWRGFYGWGNLVLFLPLFVAGLGAEGVSHLGHLGGLFGGVLAASFVPAESFAPRAEVAERLRANLRIAAVLGALPMLAGPALARISAATALPEERVEVPDAGAVLDLPWRMADNPVRFAGIPAWVVSRNHDEPIFCGLARLRQATDVDEDEIVEGWEATLDAVLVPDTPPGALGEGWGGRAWDVTDPTTGEVTARLVEHQLRRGAWLLRAGYLIVEPSGGPGREALYAHVLGTIEVSEPPLLARARREADLYPGDPERGWTLARELGRADLLEEADAAWEALSGYDGWRAEALAGRVALWADYAGTPGDARLDTREDDRVARVVGWLAEAPFGEVALHTDGLRFLAGVGRCEEARAHALQLAASADSAVFLPPIEVASVLCPGNTLSPTSQSPGNTGAGTSPRPSSRRPAR